MHCAIYKGRKQADTYLYVEQEDHFTRVPKALLERLGALEYVMSLELHANHRLALADVCTVMARLESQGYYLQLPPREHAGKAIPDYGMSG